MYSSPWSEEEKVTDNIYEEEDEEGGLPSWDNSNPREISNIKELMGEKKKL